MAILKAVYELVDINYISVNKMERATFYILTLTIHEKFVFSSVNNEWLYKQLKNLRAQWQITFDQVKTDDDNVLKINVIRIETYKIL